MSFRRIISHLDAWEAGWETLPRDYPWYNNHSVNVGLMGLALMTSWKKNRRDGLIVGLAGLFPDLGPTQLKAEIVHKIAPLNPGEREHLQRHPLLG